MNNNQLIKLLETEFPILKGNVSYDDDGQLGFSVDMDDPNENYEKLVALTPMIESHGYEVILQDDSEYFGAIFVK